MELAQFKVAASTNHSYDIFTFHRLHGRVTICVPCRRKKGLFKQFSIVCGVLAVIGFSAPLLIAWQDQEKSNFIELAVALVVLLILLPITWKLFQPSRNKK